jgi:flagella basal body P-ring formation protein FlgA
MLKRIHQLIALLSLGFVLTSMAVNTTPVVNDLSALLRQGVEEHLARRMQIPASNFQVEVSQLRLSEFSNDKSLIIRHVEVLDMEQATARRFQGLCNLPVLLTTNKGTFDAKIQALVQVIGPAFVAARNLRTDSQIGASDIRMVQLPWRQMNAGTIGQPLAELLGKRVRQMINAGEPVYGLLLENPFDIRPGEIVDLTIHSGPGVMIRSRAQAQESGRVGEAISLVQPDTKKRIRAIVTGQKAVEVRL